MNSFSTKLLASVILIIMCLFSILPTVQAAIVLNETEDDNGETEQVEENKKNIIKDNEEKNDSFQVMLAGILDKSENLDTNNLISSIPNEKGIWIKENDREYLVNLINKFTNKSYKVNEKGFLIEDTEITKSEYDNNEIYNLYTKKLDELLNKEKLIVISIADRYKQLNEIDGDIIDIRVEDDDYALLFSENESIENSNEIIILNSKKYNDTNNEETIALLMNKILEVYYYEDNEFEKLKENNKFIDDSGVYHNAVNKEEITEDIKTENKIEDMEVNTESDNEELNYVEDNEYVESSEETVNIENNINTENAESKIEQNVSEISTEINKNNQENVPETEVNIENIKNETVENVEENIEVNEKNNIFDDSVSEADFNIVMAGILSNNVNLENRESILGTKPNGNGIWISENSRQQFLSFLNKHTIYTYTVNSEGYLVCDNIMKDNANLDIVKKVETEVDVEIQNILTQNTLVMIHLDNIYLGYDETLNITSIQLTNDENVKSFSFNNQRIVILNEFFYENANFDLALSDYFIKSLENVQKKVLKGELTFNKQPLARSDISKSGNMLSAQTVYAGPASSNYATVGSVSSGEMVYLLGQSAGWYHIQYIVTSTGKQKAGFVPVATVNNNGYSVHEEQMTGGQNFVTQKVNIMSCDDHDLSVSLGSVFANEGVTVLYTYTYSDAEKSYDLAYIEISTSSGTKRGYIETSYLAGIDYPSSVARVLDKNAAYSGPDESYVRLGSVSYNEYVTILAKNTGNDWVWVEYNTTKGRKRGFMLYSNLINCNHPGLYNNLPVNNALKKATEALTVYGGPSGDSASIGSISNQEIVGLYNTEREYAYIEYSTKNGAKRGYVPLNKLTDAIAPTIPTINAYSFQEGTYGTSGKGTALKYYKIGNGENVVFAIFEQHGWEDAWAFDGVQLINIAQSVIQNLSSTGISQNWTLYIVPYANPDGITHGFTNNGPGRSTVTTKIDMNRCWPAEFQANYTSRNYTGDTALGAPEAVALKSFIESNIGTNQKIIIDIHGWLNKTYGNSVLGGYFTSQFGFSHSATFGKGYLETWGKSIGALSCLLEYPMPSSSTYITEQNYAGKTANAIRNMLNEIGGTAIEGGEETDEQVKVVSSDGNLNVRSGPGTGYTKITTLEPGTVVTRIRKGVAVANGFTWDKIRLSDNTEGYVATDYLEFVKYNNANNLSEQDVKIVKAYCRFNKINNYKGDINGIYDNNIYLTVIELQRINELTQTGFVDVNSETWDAMELNNSEIYNLYLTISDNYVIHGCAYGHSEYFVPDSENGYSFKIDMKDAEIQQAAAWAERASDYNSMDIVEKSVKLTDHLKTKGRLEVLAFACSGLFPNASDGLNHYLGNTGETMKLSSEFIEEFLDGTENRKALVEKYKNEARNAVEYMLTIDKVADFSMKKAMPLSVGKSNIDWFALIGNCYFSIEGSCLKISNNYTMTIDLIIYDYYDFDTVDGWADIIDAVTGDGGDYDLNDLAFTDVAELHYAGLARFFYLNGANKVTISWQGGE